MKRGTAVRVEGGRIGMLLGTAQAPRHQRVEVQFGADGPMEWHARSKIRPATMEEVETAGMLGVGGLLINEEEI